MTPEAKSLLSKTIRRLRDRLLDDLRSSCDSAYRFAIRNAKDAGLDDAHAARRRRIEAWLDEQVRSQADAKNKRSADDFRRELEQQAAYTLLNRLVILRLMESSGLHSGRLASEGWNSEAYKTLRQLAPSLARDDPSEGFAFLLQLVFEDLAIEMPGLFGPAGVADLVPVPPATLRAVIEALADPRLDSCWTDDMTLGWVYQYWNDPQREALDAKINAGGKIEPHEIASKTQMFTERYMVDWLLQNSLGPMWLAMCRKHGWTAEVESTGTLEELERRRAEWRAKRDAGEVELTDLMPLHSDLERRWAYYVPQPIPEDAIKRAPESVRDLRILDPAVGSGHFLIVAFDLLAALYREEARHRDEQENAEKWSERAIVERILEYNLYGIDLDPRAVQIAAAALWLKARLTCPDAHPRQLNLVASNLRLAGLPHDDPALVELCRVVEQETGLPGELTDTIVQALRGADHLGSLLQIDKAVDEAIEKHEQKLLTQRQDWQPDLFGTPQLRQQRIDFDAMATRRTLLDSLDVFLSRHTSGEDLGLRTRGEQLAAGVRFMRMVKVGSYDLVVANPPYQGTGKLRDSAWYERAYPEGKSDLFAGMTLRALELLRPGGIAAMIAISNWMYLKTFVEFRTRLLSQHLYALADLGKAAFSTGGTLISTACYIVRNVGSDGTRSVAIRPVASSDMKRDAEQPIRAQSGLLRHQGRHDFDPAALRVVPEWPLVYWWDEQMLHAYQSAPLIGDVAPAAKGICTGDDVRLTSRPWEQARGELNRWPPVIKGGKGRAWLEPLNGTLRWGTGGLVFGIMEELGRGTRFQGSNYYFRRGIAFSMIGANFSARVHRYPSIFGDMGSSIFPDDLAGAVCAMNSSRARGILTSLNPSVHFQVGDVNRLPLFPIADSDRIFAQVEAAFSVHESHREPSVEFKRPGPSPWRYAQEWAQAAVDRPDGDPLPEYAEQLDTEPPTDQLSFALGIALGRFGADGEGILDPATADLSAALPAGLLFLDGTLSEHETSDSLGHAAAKPLLEVWDTYGPQIGRDSGRKGLRRWLAGDFFKDVHKGMYENRPIHWPLSSAKRTFVAWVNIHRLDGSTLRVLLADHLQPTLTRLEGELQDLRSVRDGTDRSAAREAEKRFAQVQKWRDELAEFIRLIEQCGERGAPPTDAKCPQREVDARYEPDLDDGVMINSAALWPLLEPQWKEPKKWWQELCLANPKGNKDYDWSHLAMRYWPTRVDAKCQKDPSLGVAHGCFWRYHPARAWAWELRLQDEIGPDFRIEEKPYRGDGGAREHRDRFLAERGIEALDVIEKEVHRRRRGKPTKTIAGLTILESGLWSRLPEQCRELERRVTKKQERKFQVHAPDEQAGRAMLANKPDDSASQPSLLDLEDQADNPGSASTIDASDSAPVDQPRKAKRAKAKAKLK